MRLDKTVAKRARRPPSSLAHSRQLEAAATPLFGGQHLQAGCPPSAEDRLDELVRQTFPLHLAGQAPVVVYDAFTYADSDNGFKGGLSGPPLDGSLKVAAYNAYTGAWGFGVGWSGRSSLATRNAARRISTSTMA